jgi:cytochrome b561
MSKIAPAGYTWSQIALHWLIAALVLFQLYFGEDMAHAYSALRRGRLLTAGQILQMNLHIWAGFAVLAAILIRLVLRYRYGAPAAPASEPRLIQFLRRASHHLFYILLLAVPITGIVAYYWIPAFGRIHNLGKPAFIVLIALHAFAALWHQFYMRDGVLMRILRPASQLVLARSVGGSSSAFKDSDY